MIRSSQSSHYILNFVKFHHWFNVFQQIKVSFLFLITLPSYVPVVFCLSQMLYFYVFFLIFYNVEYLSRKTSTNIEDPIAFRLEYHIRLSILIAKVLVWLHVLCLMPFVGNFPLCVSNEMLTGQRFIFVFSAA